MSNFEDEFITKVQAFIRDVVVICDKRRDEIRHLNKELESQAQVLTDRESLITHKEHELNEFSSKLNEKELELKRERMLVDKEKEIDIDRKAKLDLKERDVQSKIERATSLLSSIGQ